MTAATPSPTEDVDFAAAPIAAATARYRSDRDVSGGLFDPPRDLRGMEPQAAKLTLDDLMTAEQVADLLLMRRSTVEDYARRGLLPSIKLGRHRRFVRTDVLAAVDALRSQAS